MGEVAGRQAHWDEVYLTRGIHGVSWFQPVPAVSLELIDVLGTERSSAVIDVGGGASTLVDHLIERGFTDVSVLDISDAALTEARTRVGPRAPVAWIHDDILAWKPTRRYGLWHDRAVFHFLTEADDQRHYVDTLLSSVDEGGGVVLATFAPDGPESCSGLPVARRDADELMDVLGRSFELTSVRRELHTTPHGVIQPFTWVAARSIG